MVQIKNQIDYKGEQTLKAVAVTQTLYNIGYKKEHDFILDFVLNHGIECYDLWQDCNPFNEDNYFDELAIALTDEYNCGYAWYTTGDALFVILESLGYDKRELKVLTPSTLAGLFNLIHPNELLEYIDLQDAVKDLKNHFKSVVTKNIDNLDFIKYVFNRILFYRGNESFNDFVLTAGDNILILDINNQDKTTYILAKNNYEILSNCFKVIDLLDFEDMEYIHDIVLKNWKCNNE